MKSHSKPRETPPPRGACSAPPKNEKWARSAVEQELNELATMPAHNINKPGSPFFVSLLKLASIVKGSHLSQVEVKTAVSRTCCVHPWIPQREIGYQWDRAYETAVSREPKETICKFDIENGRLHSARQLTDSTIEKAEQLAAALSTMLETGEKPNLENVNVDFLEQDPNGITVNLIFLKWSQSLADCVQTAVSRLDSFIWSDYNNGIFKIWLRTRTL